MRACHCVCVCACLLVGPCNKLELKGLISVTYSPETEKNKATNINCTGKKTNSDKNIRYNCNKDSMVF